MKGLVWIHQVDQMMSNPFPFLWSRFGGSDIHVSIDLHGIRADDFSSKGFCKFNHQPGFSNPGGTKENDYPRPTFLSDVNHMKQILKNSMMDFKRKLRYLQNL
jgi:hypothetical protein